MNEFLDANGELTVLHFPRFVALPEGNGYAGKELGGVRFDENGHSVGPVAYNRVRTITSGFGSLIDLATGLELSPIYEGAHYQIEWNSRFWTPYTPLPAHVVEQQAAIEARLGPKPAPKAPEAPAEAPADPRLEQVIAAIESLEKGDKDHWTNDGRPDATVLSARLGFTVTAAFRDAAWQAHLDANLTPQIVLTTLLKSKGARFLRQVAESRGIDVPRSGEGIVEKLAGVLTLDEAKAL